MDRLIEKLEAEASELEEQLARVRLAMKVLKGGEPSKPRRRDPASWVGRQGDWFSVTDMAKALQMSKSTASRHLHRLHSAGKLERRGTTSSTRYRPVKEA